MCISVGGKNAVYSGLCTTLTLTPEDGMTRLLAFLFHRTSGTAARRPPYEVDAAALCDVLIPTSALYGLTFHPSVQRHYGK
ncbi:hypothetical protein [Nissabacter archeti]|uniref:hypothetical protein n=1 Tax=Nissabacter archeti TaxID=1917880 RepID=UPI000934352D|nr:hypothetical protein [Nissabacter archeti]